MKVLSRNFTLPEKILLFFLVAFLLGLVYYFGVEKPIGTSIASYKADAEMLDNEILQIQAQVQSLQNIQKKMDDLQNMETLSYMGSYNNAKQEIDFLNDVLQKAVSYSISFDRASRNGNQIRRRFSLQYQSKSYEAAKKILKKLTTGELRCIIGDIRCSVSADGRTSMSQSATFYETMVGGIPDVELPADQASTN